MQQELPPQEEAQSCYYKGMEYANVHPLIGNLCINPEGGVDVAMFIALRDELSMDDALDLLEMDAVSRSWHSASRANQQLSSARRKAKNRR